MRHGLGPSLGAMLLAATLLAAGAAAQDWVSLSPPMGGFTALFPSMPATSSSRSVHGSLGTWGVRSWYLASGDEGYVVTVRDYSQYDLSRVPMPSMLGTFCREAVGVFGDPVVGDPDARRCTHDRRAAVVYWRPPLLLTVSYQCRGDDCEATRRDRFLTGFVPH